MEVRDIIYFVCLICLIDYVSTKGTKSSTSLCLFCFYLGIIVLYLSANQPYIIKLLVCRSTTYIAPNPLILPFITHTLPLFLPQAPFVPIGIQEYLTQLYL